MGRSSQSEDPSSQSEDGSSIQDPGSNIQDPASRIQDRETRIQHPGSSIQHAGLYIHVPFCIRKCRYCDFVSTDRLSLQHAYTDAVCREMEMVEEAFPIFDTLYIGGGTPTAMDERLLGRILEKAGSVFSFTDEPEFTVEANPGTVSKGQLESLRRVGVNRINIGVQSFLDDHLRFLGRIHTAREAENSIRLARGAGFADIGLDLIYGLPGQTEKAWIEDLAKALSFFPEHLSSYMLTFEKGTPLFADLAAGRVELCPEDTVAALFLETSEFLRARGYLHYEISNFARSARLRSRHNRKYWTLAPTLGLGPSAHSFLNKPPTRWWNVDDPEIYLKTIEGGKRPVKETEVLTEAQSMAETLFLSLRTAEGIDTAAFDRRFSVSFDRMFGKLVSELTADGLLYPRGGRWAPTLRGMQFSDAIAQRLIDRI
ncbi:MAG: radical SAM family heme chaperone HemW [Desulfobacterales bacterium]|nr:radical SAM family heme chaperone HemW [Desulfobacterales bacterium]